MMTWTNDLRIRADVAPSVTSQQGTVAYRVNRTVSQSQIVPIAGFQRPKWAAMATNPNAPGMMATGYKIALHSATHYKVTVTYSYPSGDTNEEKTATPSIQTTRIIPTTRRKSTRSRLATARI